MTTLVDMEVSLVKAFSWSLRDIDETDTQSLIMFINRLNSRGSGSGQARKRVYCDQVEL